MSSLLWLMAFGSSCLLSAAGEAGINVGTPRFSAVIRAGEVVRLVTPEGTTYVQPPAEIRGLGLHRVTQDHWATTPERAATLQAGRSARYACQAFTEVEGAAGDVDYHVDAATGDLTVQPRIQSAPASVWGVSWWLADIPLNYAILVPGNSGLRLTRDTPGTQHHFDYPMSWEAQFVVVEGSSGGFYVWADDAAGRFKRLVVERHAGGWRLGFVTMNDAPFDRLTACAGVTWRVNTYQGDWRVPARRYRDWLDRHFQPVALHRQQPAWVQHIRGCVTMGLDAEVLEVLPKHFDPRQTLLYLPDWRAAGYDRNYPDYEQPRPQLEPFVRRAHELGFRVMLHVNYFGVDPLHPLYRQFEPYQVRDPWGSHDKLWWVGPPGAPDIRFAYINPACRAWREVFTAAMKRLCERTGTDALHLDQTLCIYNDHNGRVDGMSMLEGNVALHQQLRAELPHVALSGEGLNEVTCRHEALAQRHVWGLDQDQGTFDRRRLAAAHPISSYLLRPYTIMYGYLGCAPPESAQVYAAWNEAYRRWGVISTLKPALESLVNPRGFARQLLDEVRFCQTRGVQIDMDGSWPADVAFPLRTASGQAAQMMRDGRFVCGTEQISRTITGVARAGGPGTVPGWRAYRDDQLLGLDPERWYPWFADARPPADFHICELSDGLAVGYVAEMEQMAVMELRDSQPLALDLGAMLDEAVCGTRTSEGRREERLGPWEAADGGSFASFREGLIAQPPWKFGGGGEAFARFRITLPPEATARFTTQVALDPDAVGKDKSDGATFVVRASDGQRNLQRQVHAMTAERVSLELELTSLRGKEIWLELAVGPGPRRSPNFDWARWYQPRVTGQRRSDGVGGIAGGSTWRHALGRHGLVAIEQNGETRTVRVPVPATVYLLSELPSAVNLPQNLPDLPFQVLFVDDSGLAVPSSLHAQMVPGENTVGGVPRAGFSAHPPDRGRTIAVFPLSLPENVSHFETWVGLRDGSRSQGVAFAVEVNGAEMSSRRVVPGPWERLEVDLRQFAGQPVVMALITDAAGSFEFDWAAWGTPVIHAK